MRVAMADEFTKIQDSATIDNYLAGTTQSSKQDERGMFQRTSAEVEVDPTVPASSRSGPVPGRMPAGMRPNASPTAPLLK